MIINKFVIFTNFAMVSMEKIKKKHLLSLLET